VTELFWSGPGFPESTVSRSSAQTEEQIVSVLGAEDGSGSSPARPSDILSSGLLSVFVT
jgi:hypothetical protein